MASETSAVSSATAVYQSDSSILTLFVIPTTHTSQEVVLPEVVVEDTDSSASPLLVVCEVVHEEVTGSVQDRLTFDLPPYMLPDRIIVVNYIPVTKHGKLAICIVVYVTPVV